jgi:Na+/melibiose symporter-like transporter
MIVISAILLDEKKFEKNKPQKNEDIASQNYDSIESNNVKESDLSNKSELKKQMELFWMFLKMDLIYKPILFIFFYMLAPSYGDPLFYFYTNVLKFSPLTMGRLRLIYGIASVLGITFYNRYLRNVGFKKIMWWTTILSMMFNMLSILVVSRFNLKLGIPDFLFCMTADALTTALAEINTMPLLVLACNICPKNIEGTLYAFIMSVINLGSLFSNQFGSYFTAYLGITATNFTNLTTLIVIANLVLILPMPSLYLVDDGSYIISSNNEDVRRNNSEVNKSDEQAPLNKSENKINASSISTNTSENSFILDLDGMEEKKTDNKSLLKNKFP